ncbi:MAG: hypothetical protein COB85_08230 [Bacteroidetes bacterium]|nr:MAG: hypothetical protein COB85_08230 [Bacteroidota bacterium]
MVIDNRDSLNNVTYIIGAGASATALPLASNLPRRLINLSGYLKDNEPEISNEVFNREVIANLRWLGEEALKPEFQEVDTYAKDLYLHRKYDELARVKQTLSTFFTIEQFILEKSDPRYKNLLIRLMDNSHVFPENVKILNWNYDFQFEIAAEHFRQEKFSYGGGASQHSPPLIPYYPGLGYNDRNMQGDISMVHLNGLAGFYYYEQTGHILNYFLNGTLKTIDDLYERIQQDSNHKHHLLIFGWERHTQAGELLKHRLSIATKMIEETDILVIIGYSFPEDNIETDTELFKVLNNVKRIYFQNPEMNGAFLTEQFSLDPALEIVHETKTNKFLRPREISLKRTAKSLRIA